MCSHPAALETFKRVCPSGPRMAGFIDFTAPGESIPAADVAALGEKQFGRPLCRACYKLAMDAAKAAQNGGDAHDPGPQAPAAQG